MIVHTITKRESNMWYVMKTFAVFFVVMAHMCFSENYHTAEIIRTSIGQIGVVIFFISSGYFYSRKPNDSKVFWKKKLKTFFLPWFFLATGIFFLSAILFGVPENLPIAYLKNLFGIGTLYWYMTVTTFFMILFKFDKKDFILYICIVISVISIILSATGLIIYKGDFNQYLNVFNWVGFFAAGVLLRKYNILQKLINIKFLIASFLGVAIAIIVATLRNRTVEAYIDITSLLLEISGFVFVLNISNILANNNIFIDIGKKSFFIYLVHIQIVGVINTRLPYNALFFILRPVIGLTVCYVIAVVFKFMLNKIKLGKYNFVFGLDR